MSGSTITISLGLFVLAGLFEIAGGWLVWQWIRNAKPWPWGLFGGLILFLYGIIPTFQPAHFGRVYATHGGIFIVLSLFWGWFMDGNKPDLFDLIGGGVTLLGIAIIMSWPR
jgi:small multidrug resistance family-3 protein